MKKTTTNFILAGAITFAINYPANAFKFTDFISVCNTTVRLPSTSGTCIIKSYKAKQINNKNYINCDVLSNTSDYSIVLEKSTDGQKFSIARIIKGQISPVNQSLMYSFEEDADSKPSATTYRISVCKILNTTDGIAHLSHPLSQAFDNAPITISFSKEKQIIK